MIKPRHLVVLAFIFINFKTFPQEKRKITEYHSGLQFSLFPGIGTNGITSGSYYNAFAFNLFGGLSAGNRYLELGAISNVNLKSTTGIQLAGLANIVGANAFVNLTTFEERELINDQKFESNVQGIQAAGLLNYVRDHAYGIQIAGLLNVVGGDIRGFQLAGIGNSSGNGTNGYSEGVQIAGLYNLAGESIAGFQITTLFNYTNGELTGGQISLINKARVIKGRHTMPPTKTKAIQIGLINFSSEMDGTQVGLFNFGGKSLGNQFGLINFRQKYPTKEQVRKGTPVALLNFGSRGNSIRVTFNEVFPLNVQYTTGNCLNCSVAQSEMPFDDANQIFNQNALIMGFDPVTSAWGFGYGFEKQLFNKSSMLPTDVNNRKRLIIYGVTFMHLNRQWGQFDKSFNLLNKLHAEIAKRKWGHYVMVGVSLNYFMYESGTDSFYRINTTKIPAGKPFGFDSYLWPGYTIGFQL